MEDSRNSLPQDCMLDGVGIAGLRNTPRPESPRFERNSDGEVEYSVAFDVHNFAPNDIKISVADRVVTVYAQSMDLEHHETHQFRNEIRLPDNIDTKQLRSVYRKDGHLVLRAPVLPPNYNRNGPNSPQLPRSPLSGRMQMKPSGASGYPFLQDFPLSPSMSRSPHMLDRMRPGSPHHFFGRNSPLAFNHPQHLFGDSTNHINVHPKSSTPVPTDRYSDELVIDPEFHGSDLSITVRDGVVHIFAKRENAHRNQEYKNEYQLPTNVDGSKLTAKLGDGVLLLEAPYRQPKSTGVFTNVNVVHE